MQPRKLTAKEVVQCRVSIAKKQGGKCAVCKRALGVKVVGCLDHNHTTGFVRGVLCRACNRLEGQVKNRVLMAGGKEDPESMLQALVDYWREHKEPKWPYIHPTHKTEAEKRLAANAKARAKRAALKKGK